MFKKLHGLWEYRKCKICGKRFIRIKKISNVHHGRGRAVGIRRRGCKTCSKKCARIYSYNMPRRKNETKTKRLGKQKNIKNQ
jgi:hypothetical protein